MTRVALAVCLVAVAAGLEAGPRQASAPANPAPAARPEAARGRAAVQVDEQRVRRLYVSNRPADHAVNYDFEADVRQRTEAEARYADASRPLGERPRETAAPNDQHTEGVASNGSM